MREDRKSNIIPYLQASAQHIGRLYPVLLDRNGNVVDGNHRLQADPKWPTMKLEGILSEEESIIARLIANVCRRSVSAAEKREMLGKLGGIYLKEGIHPGKIANKIADETGMSYRWAMKYLPDNFKERPGLGGPSNFAEFVKSKENRDRSNDMPYASEAYISLILDGDQKPAVVKSYVNTKFVNIVLDKNFYSRFEKIATKFSTSPETIINNALLLALKQLENAEKGD